VANHISWIDIVAIGSVADVTFVARDDLAQWPVVGFFPVCKKPFMWLPQKKPQRAVQLTK
jgi:1-acyl-sn-glycerol-3-phosphate acyltransferase